jgi:hypothetical protein
MLPESGTPIHAGLLYYSRTCSIVKPCPWVLRPAWKGFTLSASPRQWRCRAPRAIKSWQPHQCRRATATYQSALPVRACAWRWPSFALGLDKPCLMVYTRPRSRQPSVSSKTFEKHIPPLTRHIGTVFISVRRTKPSGAAWGAPQCGTRLPACHARSASVLISGPQTLCGAGAPPCARYSGSGSALARGYRWAAAGYNRREEVQSRNDCSGKVRLHSRCGCASSPTHHER